MEGDYARAACLYQFRDIDMHWHILYKHNKKPQKGCFEALSSRDVKRVFLSSANASFMCITIFSRYGEVLVKSIGRLTSSEEERPL